MGSETVSIKLVALDIDGTLLDEQGVVTSANLEAIEQAKAQNVKIILATARKYNSTAQIAEILSLGMPMICQNGASIREKNGAEWLKLCLPLSCAQEIAAHADANNLNVAATIDEVNYFREYPPYPPIHDDHTRTVKSLRCVVTVPPTRMMTLHQEATESILNTYAGPFRDQLRFSKYAHEVLVISHANATKENSLSSLCQRLGISATEIMAIGDSEADIGMLRYAKIGIAMGNATTPVKEAADYVAPENNENGVAWAIQQFILEGV